MRTTTKKCQQHRRGHISVVSAQEFIRAIARKRNSHLRTRHCTQQYCWNLTAICEWFVIDFRKSRHDSHRIFLHQFHNGVIGPKRLCSSARSIGFVIRPIGKTNGECFDGRVACTRHKSRNERAINPSREKRAQRHIGNHSPRDCSF